ncbi:14341_t:CDS:1, partial [Funneliformis geosporum]
MLSNREHQAEKEGLLDAGQGRNYFHLNLKIRRDWFAVCITAAITIGLIYTSLGY